MRARLHWATDERIDQQAHSPQLGELDTLESDYAGRNMHPALCLCGDMAAVPVATGHELFRAYDAHMRAVQATAHQ